MLVSTIHIKLFFRLIYFVLHSDMDLIYWSKSPSETPWKTMILVRWHSWEPKKKHSQGDGPQPFKMDIPRKFSVLKGQQIQAYNLFTQ